MASNAATDTRRRCVPVTYRDDDGGQRMSLHADPDGGNSHGFEGKESLPEKRREKRPRETSDLAGSAARQILSVGRRIADEDVDDLSLLVLIELSLQEAYRVAVDGLRRSGYTDAEIGDVLGGIIRQAVQWKWPRSASEEDGR